MSEHGRKILRQIDQAIKDLDAAKLAHEEHEKMMKELSKRRDILLEHPGSNKSSNFDSSSDLS